MDAAMSRWRFKTYRCVWADDRLSSPCCLFSFEDTRSILMILTVTRIFHFALRENESITAETIDSHRLLTEAFMLRMPPQIEVGHLRYTQN